MILAMTIMMPLIGCRSRISRARRSARLFNRYVQRFCVVARKTVILVMNAGYEQPIVWLRVERFLFVTRHRMVVYWPLVVQRRLGWSPSDQQVRGPMTTGLWLLMDANHITIGRPQNY